ncbi:signal recognition particle, SRP9/SRP14 subunit [Amylostereum chailletii]|nr:signal recognition particle, SRP9/SRP14 subunit [Amylostereum chailletii]
MVYINSWQQFQDAAEALYTTSPTKTRYCVKWKSSEGKLVLKITDDTTCLKFKTHSSVFLNRFEMLNRTLMQKMTNARPPTLPIPATVPPRTATSSPAPGGSTPRSSTPLPTPAPAGGGVKKKKGKKR